MEIGNITAKSDISWEYWLQDSKILVHGLGRFCLLITVLAFLFH